MKCAQARRRTGSAIPTLGFALLIALSAGVLVTAPGAADGQEAANLEGTDSAFAGMVDVPAGKFEMGIDEKWFKDTFLKNRRLVPPQLNGPQKDDWWKIFLLETPAHSVTTEAYAIDRYEVTNLQYLKFLDEACQVVVFVDSTKKTIEQVAAEIYGDKPSTWQIQSLYWLNEKILRAISKQVVAANPAAVKRAIESFNRDLPPQAHKKEFDELPEPNQVKAWQEFELPAGTAIKGYTRTVPKHWKKAQPVQSDNVDEDQRSQAVRFVSGEDAAAFAAWAGKHVPTEAEWEKAARGPENTIYPWGDTWDAVAQSGILIWNGANAWKGAPGKDRPAVVTACPSGQSGYGCFNMLGNVMEWTSSIPERYPRSDSKWGSFGGRDLRVCRGGGYGGGVAYKSLEISMRATARILDGPDGPVDAGNVYSALGFRCAKYHTPARDTLAHRLEAVRRGGFLPLNFAVKPEAGFGVERPSYQASDEKAGMVFVARRSLVAGVIPVESLDAVSPKDILDKSEKEPVILGFAYWDPSMKVAMMKLVKPRVEKPPVEIPEGGADGSDDDEGEGEGERPDEGGSADDDGDGSGESAGGEEGAPVAPTEERTLVNGEPNGFLLAIWNRRLALYENKLAGVELYGYLPQPEGAGEIIRKEKEKDYKRSAHLNGDRMEFDIPILTRSSSSRDLFALRVSFEIEGAPLDGWLATEE